MAARSLLLFAAVACVVVVAHNAAAITLSSRLIHRFSDEAMELRVSRNGSGFGNGNGEVVGSWPRRKTLEYYRMLVARDFQRQKMKLQFQLLFPSEGSQTMSFGNDFGWLHYTWIDVGTPNVSFLVALDTGSDLLWVPCDCIQCAPLSSSYYSSLDRDLSEYNPSVSNSSKQLPCSHQLCESGPNCKSSKQPCPYVINYISENTSSSGLLVEDILHLAAGGNDSSNSSVQAPVIIGCGMKQSGGYLDGVAPDGLMGLGPGEISVPSFLAKSGYVKNSFSFCFDEDSSGRIYFGDQGPANQHSTTFLPTTQNGNYETYIVGVEACCIGNSCIKQSGFQAMVDSGTSFSFLPQEMYEVVSKEFDRRVNATRANYEGYPWNYCYKVSSQAMPKIPSVTLVFPANNSFVIQNPVFVANDGQGVNGFCLAIQPADGDLGVIGHNFMTGYRMVFDRETMKLGWSRSNCEDLSDAKGMHLTPPPKGTPSNPLPTNEQQSAPGNQAVAPAVAGRTPKPSAASARLTQCFYLLRVSFMIGLFHLVSTF